MPERTIREAVAYSGVNRNHTILDTENIDFTGYNAFLEDLSNIEYTATANATNPVNQLQELIDTVASQYEQTTTYNTTANYDIRDGYTSTYVTVDEEVVPNIEWFRFNPYVVNHDTSPFVKTTIVNFEEELFEKENHELDEFLNAFRTKGGGVDR